MNGLRRFLGALADFRQWA